jgi:ParB/RepB/Spo0J family partition protein
MTTEQKSPAKRRTVKAPESPAPVIETKPAQAIAADDTDRIIVVDLDTVNTDPDQPRKCFDHSELVELGNNIRENGQLMPIRVSLNRDIPGTYNLEDGERRWRACHLSNIKTIRAIVVPAQSANDRLVLQMSANTGKPLLPMETANGYRRLLDSGWEYDRIAKKFGVSIETVKLDIMLTNLTPKIQDAVNNGLSKTVGRRLSTITDPSRQNGAFERCQKSPNDKKKLAAIEAYLGQVAQSTGAVPATTKATAGEVEEARKVWGALKSGFSKFKASAYSNGKGSVLVGPAMKSADHRKELEATAKELRAAADKILADLNSYTAMVEQNRPMA